MKHFKPLIIYLSILSFITLAIFSNNPLKVYAEVPTTQKAVAHEGTWTGYNFDVDIFGKYWTIQDISEIPINSFTGNQYYYTFDNVKFTNISASEVYGLILTRGMGLVYAPDKLSPLLQAFFSEITNPKYSGFVQGGVYDGSNNLIGYALNDITGCYYEGITISNDTPYTVPDNQVDNVYNFFEYYTSQSTTVPDYFIYTCPTDTYVAEIWNKNNRDYRPEQEEGRINNYNVIKSSYDNCLNFKIGIDPSTKQIQNSRTWYGTTVPSFNFTDYENITYISSSNENTWTSYCNDYHITKEDNNFLFTDLAIATEEKVINYALTYKAFDTNTLQETTTRNFTMSGDINNPNINYTNTTNDYYLGVAGQLQPGQIFYSALQTPTGTDITIFKDIQTYNSLVVNKTYNNDYYKSTTYNNYDTTNDNSFTVNYSSVVNSTTNNTTIYNDTQDIFYDNVDNGGSIVVPAPDITIIINNIIPDYTEPDPDDPSGGGGSGGSGDGDDINDDNVLSALLAAIRHFFKIIGQLIGTILTGLLEVINAILESITGIMESMTGVTDFISALFSWIPEPVPQVLGLAISITILCALIRFIRG